MIIQLQKALVDSLQQFSNVNADTDQTPQPATIGMIVGLTLFGIILFAFFLSFAYCFPWYCCYNYLCHKCVSNACCNCIRCYYVCPCMESKAFQYQLNKNQNSSKVFIQDLLTTPDGRIIHLSNITPIEKPNNNKVNITSPRLMNRFSESELI